MESLSQVYRAILSLFGLRWTQFSIYLLHLGNATWIKEVFSDNAKVMPDLKKWQLRVIRQQRYHSRIEFQVANSNTKLQILSLFKNIWFSILIMSWIRSKMIPLSILDYEIIIHVV